MYHFLTTKTFEIHVNICITVKDLREIPFIPFYVTVEIWKHLKVHLPFRCFLRVSNSKYSLAYKVI